tara:strand:+ start:2758 stop:3702 length:945 start_codon:yes stop_codon:yes gene_type:complete
MKIIISFLTTNFTELKKYWGKNKTKTKKSKFCGTDKVFDVNLGGKLIIIDWEKKKIVKEKNITTPAGLDVTKNKIYVCTSGNKISILNHNLKIKKTIINKYLNDLHSLNLVGSKYILLTSTGLDSILMIDKKGKLYWSWFATENGYNRDTKGRIRIVDRKINHRNKKYPTLQQTTHLNSAFYAGKTKYYGDTIYCLLFHQGEIIAIDKKTLETKKVMGGLKHPHSIYLLNKKMMVSDTENHSIIISDKNFNKIRREKIKNVGWIQDATFLKNGNILISDPDNNRIIEFNPKNKKIIQQMDFNKEWRIYQAKELY